MACAIIVGVSTHLRRRSRLVGPKRNHTKRVLTRHFQQKDEHICWETFSRKMYFQQEDEDICWETLTNTNDNFARNLSDD